MSIAFTLYEGIDPLMDDFTDESVIITAHEMTTAGLPGIRVFFAEGQSLDQMIENHDN